MSKKKIYFYGVSSPVSFGTETGVIFYNTVPLYLNAHLKRERPDLHEQIEWTKINLFRLDEHQLIEELNDLDIDILCISLYTWNSKLVLDAVRNIKSKLNKNITIIAGGPDIDIYRNKDYLHKNSFIDFVVYTQGEHAFVNILDHLITGKTLNTLNTKNLAWLDKNNQLRISDFEFVRNTDGSPYLESKELLLQMRDDLSKTPYKVTLPYETTRGCPYKCTFCDWNAGLTGKVSKREFDYEEELDFLGRNGITQFQMSDANFGIFKRDLEIATIMARLKKERGYNFSIWGNNFNKLKKDAVFKIVDIMLDADILEYPKFALQDIDPQTLIDIDRPDVPWLEHKTHIEQMAKKYPKKEFRVELIVGMPGQTVESWERTLIDTAPFTLSIYPLIVIPNSPLGYDLDYRNRLKIKIMQTDINSIYVMNDKYQAEIVCETYSFSFDDYVYMLLLSLVVPHMPKKSNGQARRDLIEKIKLHKKFNFVKERIKKHLLNSDCNLLTTEALGFYNIIKHGSIK